MIIIMLGAPASGKGSVSEILSKELNIPAVSSGDIFRKHISEGTEIGKKLNEYVTKGELVPDSIVLEMLEARLNEEDAKGGLILDGFVRTIPQAEALDKMLETRNQKIDAVVNLETSTEEILERVTNRRICRKCKAVYNLVLNPSKVEGICDKCGGELYQREDQKPEVVENRLKVSSQSAEELINHYENAGILYNAKAGYKVGKTSYDVAKEVEDYINK